MAYVYIIENFEVGTYKIGFTKCKTEKRLKQLQTGNHVDLDVIYSFETKHNRKLETFLHGIFSSKRLTGEWFQLNENDLKEIPQIMKQYEDSLDFINKMSIDKSLL